MPESLAGRYATNEAVRQERKSFLALSRADQKAVGELKRWFAEIALRMIDDFYRHLQAYPATARFLQEPKSLQRLKREQLRYFEELMSGESGFQRGAASR